MHQKQRISHSVTPSLPLCIKYINGRRKDVSVDKSRYKFTQNGATATNKTLANAVKNMFYEKGYKYLGLIRHPFFAFIFNFDIFVDIFSSKSTRGCQPSHSLCPRSCGSACTKPTIVQSSTHVSPHLLLHLLSHPNITNSLLSAFFPSISKMHLSAEISRQLQAFLKRPSLESAIPCQTRTTSTAACSSATASHFATSSLRDSKSQRTGMHTLYPFLSPLSS